MRFSPIGDAKSPLIQVSEDRRYVFLGNANIAQDCRFKDHGRCLQQYRNKGIPRNFFKDRGGRVHIVVAPIFDVDQEPTNRESPKPLF